ncbi:MAG: flippase [Armatimonadota bacterium]|nr:flippase [Armatimonadota bacterium]MDR7519657.1 flippase [Armatimonadota bacterium]
MTVETFTIGSRLLVRNGLLALAGQAVPFVVGVASVPAIVHGLGMERFGLLALTWTLIGAFSVFDLGLGRAVTKLVAEALGTGERTGIPGIIWSAVMAQAAFGIFGAGVLALAASPVVTRLLNVAPQMHAEAVASLRILAPSLPVVLVSFSFQGALEAAQRFDLLAGVKIVSSTSTFLVPLAGALFSWDLPTILAGMLVVRSLVLIVYAYACIRALALLRLPVSASRGGFRSLLTFGTWITVSGLVALILAPADKLIIGHQLTMTALTHYAIPQELIARLGVISAGMAVVLFPAFSTLGGAQDLLRVRVLFSRSTEYLVLTMAPAFGLIAVLAPDILRVWLGSPLAEHSAPVLQILAVGAAVQLLAVSPYVLLQGLGRPDLTAKFHLLVLPLSVATMWWLVRLYGIRGAAFVWTGRVAFEAFLLLWAALRMGMWTWEGARKTARRVLLPVVVVCSSSLVVHSLPAPLAPRVVLIGSLLPAFAWWVWARSLEAEERRWIVRLLMAWRRLPVRMS